MRILLLLITCFLTACAPVSVSSLGTDRLPVVASIYPLAYLAQRIGGDAVTVTTVVPGGAEPHDYEPTPGDIAGIYQSKLLITHGAGMDPWAERIAPDLTAHGVTVLTATAELPLQMGLPEDADEKNTTMVTDPHAWNDPILLQMIADHIRESLIARDPAHEALYTDNAEKLRQDITALDAEFRNTLTASCRLHTVIVSHDAFEYLGKRYGIEMLPIAGLSPDTEPSPARIIDLAKIIQEKNIHVVTFETLVSPKIANVLAEETGARTLVLNPIEGLTSDEVAQGEDLLTLMHKNLQVLAEAMECRKQ